MWSGPPDVPTKEYLATFMNMRFHIDRDLEPGTVEFRDPVTGELLGRIVNLQRGTEVFGKI